jgi:hypothetical protein
MKRRQKAARGLSHRVVIGSPSSPLHTLSRIAIAVVGWALVTVANSPTVLADPLPGRDVLKFQQLPLDNLTYPVGDPVNGFQNRTYWGHDNFSTAYSELRPNGMVYVGGFMADDFADRFMSPVVHVKWWGSYLNFNPELPVDKFLISFEEDIPADPNDPTSFSQPGQPLLNQIVRRGPLAPGSGTFTETPFSPGGAPLFEQVFEYNAELHLGKEFPQQADTVYWLKIVALVDDPTGWLDDQPSPGTTQWGWHTRDYSKFDFQASTPPDVVPGERLDGFLNPTPAVAVYHFQDDAVTGGVLVDPNQSPMGFVMPEVLQTVAGPTHYLDDIDGPGPTGLAGPIVMSFFSQDLAFELYTVVPEPSCFMLLIVGVAGIRGSLRSRVTWAGGPAGPPVDGGDGRSRGAGAGRTGG